MGGKFRQLLFQCRAGFAQLGIGLFPLRGLSAQPLLQGLDLRQPLGQPLIRAGAVLLREFLSLPARGGFVIEAGADVQQLQVRVGQFLLQFVLGALQLGLKRLRLARGLLGGLPEMLLHLLARARLGREAVREIGVGLTGGHLGLLARLERRVQIRLQGVGGAARIGQALAQLPLGLVAGGGFLRQLRTQFRERAIGFGKLVVECAFCPLEIRPDSCKLGSLLGELDLEFSGVLLGGGVGQLPRGLDPLALGGLEIHPRAQPSRLGGGLGEALALLGLRLGQRGFQLFAAGNLRAQGLP
ncbi:MAG: hypothetical protein ACKODH_11575 [Limisphaerales bacterium]